jgi:Holliday junction resolvasome RuvABC endonuclease subunit
MKTKAKKPKKKPTYAALPCGTVLMALDVSSSVTGWAVGLIAENRRVEHVEFGLLKPTQSWPSTRRIDWMREEVLRLIMDHEPTAGCLEWQSHKRTHVSVQGLAVLGQSQGILFAAMSDYIPTDRVSEREWTKTNGRNISKASRCEYVKAVVPEYRRRTEDDPGFDIGKDAADALGLLLWRANVGGSS